VNSTNFKWLTFIFGNLEIDFEVILRSLRNVWHYLDISVETLLLLGKNNKLKKKKTFTH